MASVYYPVKRTGENIDPKYDIYTFEGGKLNLSIPPGAVSPSSLAENFVSILVKQRGYTPNDGPLHFAFKLPDISTVASTSSHESKSLDREDKRVFLRAVLDALAGN